MTDYKEILQEMGYNNIIDNGRELRTKPIYRDSSSNTVLSIRKDTGHFIDFSKQISGSFPQLVKLSLGFKTFDEANSFLQNKIHSPAEVIRKPEVKSLKVFPNSYLNKLIPDNKYWISRGISEQTLKIFEGGVVKSGTMADRYVFPIFSSKKELIGVSGRCILDERNDSRPKWKHRGTKSLWKYPLQVNYNNIKEAGQIILVESIGDMLSLWEADVKNVVVTFGLDVSAELISLFLKIDPSKIFVSFNNDESNNRAGNKAAEKAKIKLNNYFDKHQILISLPDEKDFGEMSTLEIEKWTKKIESC
jgi:hypothetical protein